MAVIGKDTKYGEDYVVIMWEGIRMENNGAKQGVSLVLQAKEGLEQLTVRDRLETSHIKTEVGSVRKVVERSEYERYAVADLQIQVNEMRAEMIKTDRLEMWAKYMEGGINPVLSILDDRMIKLDIGGGMMSGGSFVTNDTPSTEIISL